MPFSEHLIAAEFEASFGYERNLRATPGYEGSVAITSPVRIRRLREQMGGPAIQRLGVPALRQMVDILPNWDFAEVKIANQRVSLFPRWLDVPPGRVNLPNADQFTGQIFKDHNVLALVVPEPTNKDAIFILDVEDNVTNNGRNDEQLLLPQSTIEAMAREKAIEAARELYVLPDEDSNALFTNRQKAILSLSTHFSSQEKVANALEENSISVSKILAPLKPSLVKANHKRSFVFLTHCALSFNFATLDHIPYGLTDELSLAQKEALNSIFGENYLTEAIPYSDDNGKNWKRLMKAIDTYSRHRIMLCAIKDGIIDVPTKATLEAQIRG
jgi:hypothetical protein